MASFSSDPHTTNLSLGDDFQTTTKRNAAAVAVRKNSSSSSSTRRKNSRANNEKRVKKMPQRGMGVAQLERLRLEERWKRLTQINPTPSITPLDHKAIIDGGSGFGSFGCLYGLGSKELSSSPKVLQGYITDDPHCADCHKKKRIISGDYLGLINGVKDNMFPKFPSNVAGCDFMTGILRGEGVVGLDKKEGSSSRMEYEFFPSGKGGLIYKSYEESSPSNNNDFLMMKNKMIMESPEASCVTTTGGGGSSVDANNSTSIDLSLRLSY